MEDDKKLIDWSDGEPKVDLFLHACNDIATYPEGKIEELEKILWENPHILENLKVSWWDFSHNAMPQEMYERLFSCIYIGWHMRELYEKDNL